MFLWKLHKNARDATCSRSCRNLSSGFSARRGSDQVLFHRRRDRYHDLACSAGLLSLVCQVADRRGDPEDVTVAWHGRMAPGEVRDAPQPVPQSVWMNEQLAGTGLDGAAAVQIGVQC